MGRQWKVSMPHDTGSSPSNWTEFAYDHLSRMTQQTAADGSTSKMFYNETTRPDSASATSGQSVRNQDAWGRERWTLTDAFGRMIEAVEPNPGSTTAAVIGTGSSGSLKTAYAYDQLDRLTQIDQGDQIRKFAYDSLGRLTRQKLAEQTASINASGAYDPANGIWSEAFVYDSRSNITQRTDARGVKTNFSYLISGSIDPLNRLQSISYDLSGPRDTTHTIHSASSVSLEYMTTGDKSRVKKVITNGIVTEENTFDGEGRISAYEMKFDNRTSYPFKSEYSYDSAHRLAEVKYPLKHPSTTDRTTVLPSYDVASRITGMSVDGSTQLSDISYNTASQVTQLKTGAATSHARIETYGYDNQTGLLTGQTVKNTSGNRTYMDMSYSYAREGNSAGTNTGSEKTGQLTKITDNRYPDHQRVYEFDALGRLKKAKGGLAAGAVDVTANWTQEYSYDRYGNKTGVTANGVDRNNTTVPADGLAAVSINTSTNRITTSGWDYDLTGNVVRGQNASGVWQRFEYDAAGRLVKIRDDSSNIIETYTYGATRERLMTETSAGRTYYVWGGQSVIAEYTETGTGTIPTFTKSYVYAGSRLLAVSYSDGLLEFHHPDRIGTQLVTFGGTIGTIRQSTYPFGTLEQGPYSNQIFTSYDRSTSTGLDYAVNRTYSSGQSRFTQVDPIGMAAASLGNPQSNNLYAYVQNMPTDFVDPSGLDIPDIGGFDGGTVYGDRDPIWGILRGMMGSDSIPMTVIITPPGMDLPGDGGGGGRGGGGRNDRQTPPTSQPRSNSTNDQQKDYDNCVKSAWNAFRKQYLLDGAQVVTGTAIIASGVLFGGWIMAGRHATSSILGAYLATRDAAAYNLPSLLSGGVMIGQVLRRNEAAIRNKKIEECNKRYPGARHYWFSTGI